MHPHLVLILLAWRPGCPNYFAIFLENRGSRNERLSVMYGMTLIHLCIAPYGDKQKQ